MEGVYAISKSIMEKSTSRKVDSGTKERDAIMVFIVISKNAKLQGRNLLYGW